MDAKQLLGSSTAPMLTTEQLANELQIQPQTLRKRYSQTGSYFSIVPVKLINRALRWPANSRQILQKSGGSK